MSCKLCLSEEMKGCRSLVNELYFEGIPGLEFIGSVLHINVDTLIKRTESHVICYRCFHNLNSFSFYYNIVRNAQRNLERVLNCQSKSSNNYHQFMNDEFLIKSNFPFECPNDKERLNEVKQEIVEIENTDIMPGIVSVYDPLDIDKSKSDNLSIPASQFNDLSVPTNEDTLLPQNVALIHLKTNPSDVVEVGEMKVSAIDKPLGDNVFKDSSNAMDIESQENENFQDSEPNDNVLDDEGVVNCVQTKKKKRNIRAPNKDTVESLMARQKMFDKYKLQEMYINKICVLNEEQTDEMCRLFFIFTCESCKDKESYTNYKKLIEHSQTEHKSVPQVQCCCGIHITAGDGIMDHIAEHILFAPARIICKLCGKLTRRKSYQEHLSYHLPPDKRNFSCDECSTGFHNKSLLKAHIDRIHNKKKHTCEHCNKGFSYASSLKYHITRVHTPDGKMKESFMCEECGKVFLSKYNYVYHMKAHKGIVQKVKCPTCDLVVKEISLSRHIRQLHKPPPLKKCPHCDFTTKRSLTSHINRVHIKEKKLNCSFCDKKFPTNQALRFHVASRHTGIPQYSCEFCDKQFMSSGNCFSHKKRMHPQQLLEKKMKQSQLAEQAKADIPVKETHKHIDDRAMTILKALKDNSYKRFAVDELQRDEDEENIKKSF